jgi:hypothetical protein
MEEKRTWGERHDFATGTPKAVDGTFMNGKKVTRTNSVSSLDSYLKMKGHAFLEGRDKQ